MLKRSGFYLSTLRYWLLIAITLVSHAVLAFSSGELKLLSSSQEPLRAEILLPRTEQGDPYDIVRVSVPSEEAFSQAGLVHSEFLYQLKLSPMLISGGLLIKISAPQPLSRQVDLLLELSTTSQQYIQYYSLGEQNPSTQESVNTSNSNSINDNSGKLNESDSTLNSRVHKVVQGDTLWSIAEQLRPKGLTVSETMNQLILFNPDAFHNGDSTQIKLGYLLKFHPDSIDQSIIDKTLSIPEQTTSASSVMENDPVTESSPESPVLAEPVSETSNNEEAIQEVLQQLAEEYAEESQSLDIVEDQPLTFLSEQTSEVVSDQPTATAVALEDADQNNQSGQDQPLPDQSSEKQPMSEQSSNKISKGLLTELNQLIDRLKAMLDWQFVHDPIDDYRQLLTLPWIAGVLLALALIALLIRSLFKSRPTENDEQVEQSERLDVADNNLVDDSNNYAFDDIHVAHDDSVIDDSPAIYAQRDNESIDDSSSTSKLAETNAKRVIDYDAEEENLGEQAIAFPGLEELDAQMSESFLVDQNQSADYQSRDNSEDLEDIDPHKVRMDMATICMEMNDNETAREILLEIINEADEPVRTEAQVMLDSLNNQLSD